MIDIDIKKEIGRDSHAFKLDIQMQLNRGEIGCLFGESGAGKTSILRLLSGLLRPDKGTIQFADEVWFDSKQKINRPPQQRNTGMVFQDFALFPFMTVKENLNFSQAKHKSASPFKFELLRSLEIEGLLDLKPKDLSAGQKQRVALARALYQEPQLLLLDEPLSAIHSSLRSELRELLLTLHHELEITTLFISHDIDEIAQMADVIFEVKDGIVLQRYKPCTLSSHSEPTKSNKIWLTGIVKNVEQIGERKKLQVISNSNNIDLIVTEPIRKINQGEIIRFTTDYISN